MNIALKFHRRGSIQSVIVWQTKYKLHFKWWSNFCLHSPLCGFHFSSLSAQLLSLHLTHSRPFRGGGQGTGDKNWGEGLLTGGLPPHAVSSISNWLQLWRLNAFCAWLWQLAWKPAGAYLLHHPSWGLSEKVHWQNRYIYNSETKSDLHNKPYRYYCIAIIFF